MLVLVSQYISTDFDVSQAIVFVLILIVSGSGFVSVLILALIQCL